MQDSLFEDQPGFRPLAARMRPATLDDYVGQRHLVGAVRIMPAKAGVRTGRCKALGNGISVGIDAELIASERLERPGIGVSVKQGAFCHQLSPLTRSEIRPERHVWRFT